MKRIVYHIALVLIVAQLMLILVSWLLSATLSEHVRSLLSDEGLRWFAGVFSRLLLTPLLSWLLLCAMAYGCLRKSGITRIFFWPKNYREQLAFRLTLFLIVLMVGGMILLSMVPHAILLSATGRLFPSPFGAALVPMLAFLCILASAAYGLVVRRFSHVYDVFSSMIAGLSSVAPLLLLYLLFMQLYVSLRYVFG
jgi:aminobenzoyl-glutamate transport protein